MRISIYSLHQLVSNVTRPVQIADGIAIISNNIDLKKIKKINLSQEDKCHLMRTRLYLQINEDVVCPEEASIAFIVSCRLLYRTKVFVRYRVNSLNEIIKIRDDYPFVPGRNTAMINNQEFKKIAMLYAGLNKFKAINKRTQNAVYFLYLAYRSRGWLESLIFHVCAVETLTSAPNIERNITQKFKERTHNFTGLNKDWLEKIYNVRSELVHGRYSTNSTKENLRLCKIAEEASRKMFAKILLESKYLTAFKNDTSRMKLF